MMETVLQFGTGMLLRAISAAAVDDANRAGIVVGKIAIVQSTPRGLADAMNRQRGAFTLVEKGLENGAPVRRTRQIESISRALIAETEWDTIRDIVSRPELRVVVSNVTESGFRLAPDQPPADSPQPPAAFPERLTDLLHTRFTRLPNGPSLFIIPTELVPDNGPQLAAMVDTVAGRFVDAAAFRVWIAAKVRFCSSLVDRITIGAPTADPADVLVTVTEPHSLWAIECDPVALREAFPIDAASNGTVVFASDITFYRERKLRLLNGTHTAIAPMAMMKGLRTVREAVADDKVGPFLRRVLFDEIAPSTDLDQEEAKRYASLVVDRFANPSLDHEWQVILTNQTAKLRVRVVPSILGFVAKFGRIPDELAWAFAASLRYARTDHRSGPGSGEGWWRGRSYRIVDVDHELIDRHWRTTESPAEFSASVLADAGIWGSNLAALPGMIDVVTRALVGMEHP